MIVDFHGRKRSHTASQAKVAPLSEEDLILIKKCEGGTCDPGQPDG